MILLGQWVDPFETECIIEQKKITSIEMQVGMQMSTFIGINLQGTTADELEIRPISIHQHSAVGQVVIVIH